MYVMLKKKYLDSSAFKTLGPHEVIAKISRYNSSVMYLVRREHRSSATNGANPTILTTAMGRNQLLYFAEDNDLFTLKEIKDRQSHPINSCWWLNQGDIDEVQMVNAEAISCLKTDSF